MRFYQENTEVHRWLAWSLKSLAAARTAVTLLIRWTWWFTTTLGRTHGDSRSALVPIRILVTRRLLQGTNGQQVFWSQ